MAVSRSSWVCTRDRNTDKQLGVSRFAGCDAYNTLGRLLIGATRMMAERPVMPSSHNLPFVEQMLADYRNDPASVPASWREYFDRWPGETGADEISNGYGGPHFSPASIFNPTVAGRDGFRPVPSPGTPRATAASSTLDIVNLQDRVDQMIRAYRVRGHVVAQTDPLGTPRPYQPELDPGFYGFTEADMDLPFSTRTIYGPDVSTLREIVNRLRNTYCRFIGVQFMHIDQIGVRHWLQDRMEGTENRCTLTREEQLRILTRLTDAVIFEEFIQRKYVGAKTFSLEGGESLIPLLDLAIEKAGGDGVREIVLGMAHRGRLNVLANIMGKSPREVFREFEDCFLLLSK